MNDAQLEALRRVASGDHFPTLSGVRPGTMDVLYARGFVTITRRSRSLNSTTHQYAITEKGAAVVTTEPVQ